MRILILFAISLFIFIFFLNHGCFLQEDPETVDPYFWDFGRVKEDSILKHTFILKNESKNTLSIKRLQTSCGCTGSVSSTNEVLPGKTSEIEVTFNTRGYKNNVKQFVYVHTNDPKDPIIKLTVVAEIINNKK